MFLLAKTGPDFSLLDRVTLSNVVIASIIVVASIVLIRFADRLFGTLSTKAPRARFFFKMLAPILNFGITALCAAWVTYIFAPTAEAFWALTASVGIAIGFGAQDLVKNLIGGVVILTDRPYQLGDRVQIGSAYGEIDHIGLRSTKMTNADDTRITIPNSEVMTGHVWNSNSGVPDAQVVTDIFLPHYTEPATAIRIGYEAAFSSPYLLQKKPVVVLCADQFGQRPYLRLRIKAYVYDHRFEPRLQSDVTVRAKQEFLRLGILGEHFS
jgi:small-conductance mechanosensitive channel